VDPRSSLNVLRTVKLHLTDPGLAWRNERHAWGELLARRKLERLGLLQMYRRRPEHTYAPQYVDLLNIYELVRRRRPQIIIEFGSGCSTLMFARALADIERDGGDRGQLYSVETHARFKALTESYLPEELAPFVDISVSSIEVGKLHDQDVMWHTQVPNVSPNLVYLDGPDYHEFSAKVRTQADGVRLEPRAAHYYAILIDGRWDTFEFTRRHLKRGYKVTTDAANYWELLEGP
jgi:hypothetical protein